MGSCGLSGEARAPRRRAPGEGGRLQGGASLLEEAHSFSPPLASNGFELSLACQEGMSVDVEELESWHEGCRTWAGCTIEVAISRQMDPACP